MEQENLSKSAECERLVSINTIADGSCLIHSVLKACYSEYQNNSDVSYRVNMAAHFRKRLSEYILEPNSQYETKKQTAEMIKRAYKTTSPRNFFDFLRTMYNYKNDSMNYPYEPLSMNELIKYNIEGIEQYEIEYKKYLSVISNNIKTGRNDKTKIPVIDKCYIDTENEIDRTTVENILTELNEIYKELENFINTYISQIRDFLEYILKDELYLPNNFNSKIIETILENVKEFNDETIERVKTLLPKGIYSEYHYNSNLFTISEAAPLVKFEYEYNELDEIVKLGDIASHLNSRNFIGDADAMLYVPHIFGINLIIMDFDNCSVIAIYENKSSEHFVIVNNINNVHFETVGLKDDSDMIETLFHINHPLIQECLKREEKINLDFLKNSRIVVNEIQVPSFDIETKIRECFGNTIDKFRLLEQDDKYAYIVFKENKTIYRFYINIKGDIVSGYAPERIKWKLKKLF